MTRTIQRLLGGVATAMVLAVILAGCSTTGASQSPTPSVSATALDDLSDTSWVLTAIGDTAPMDATNVTMAFDRDDRVSGNSGCNSYAGQATIDGTSISFGPLASTQMACIEPEATAQEAAYLAALGGATSWQVVDGNLQLGGTTDLVFKPEQ